METDEENTATEKESKPRIPGRLQGKIKMSDDFDEPMTEEELALWYDAPIFPQD